MTIFIFMYICTYKYKSGVQPYLITPMVDNTHELVYSTKSADVFVSRVHLAEQLIKSKIRGYFPIWKCGTNPKDDPDPKIFEWNSRTILIWRTIAGDHFTNF